MWLYLKCIKNIGLLCRHRPHLSYIWALAEKKARPSCTVNIINFRKSTSSLFYPRCDILVFDRHVQTRLTDGHTLRKGKQLFVQFMQHYLVFTISNWYCNIRGSLFSRYIPATMQISWRSLEEMRDPNSLFFGQVTVRMTHKETKTAAKSAGQCKYPALVFLQETEVDTLYDPFTSCYSSDSCLKPCMESTHFWLVHK